MRLTRDQRRGPDAPLERRWRPGRPVDLVATLGPMRRGSGDPTFRYDGRRRTGLWRATRDAGRPGDPAPRGAPGRRRGRRHRLGSRRRLGRSTGCPPCSARTTTPSGFAPAHPVLRDTWRSRPGWRVPRIRPGAGGAGARRARAEGHRPRGLARLAHAGPAVRRAGARSGRPPAGRAAGRRRTAAAWARGPVLGLAPRRCRPVPLAHRRHRRGSRRPARGSSARPPAGRGRDRRCAPCPASASGPRPRSGSAPSVTPTRCRSATSTSRRWSAGRWSGRRSTTTRCSSCSSPTAATATGVQRMIELSGIGSAAARPAVRRRDYRAM